MDQLGAGRPPATPSERYPAPPAGQPYVAAGATDTAIPTPPQSRSGLGPDRLPERPPYEPPSPQGPVGADPAPPPPKPRGWSDLIGAFAAGALGTIVVLTILFAAGAFGPTETQATTDTTVIERVTTQIVTPNGEMTSVEAVAAKVIPSIVTVEVGDVGTDGFVAVASGSGVVIDAGGLIVTNQHVIADASASRVVFQDGRIYQSDIVGSDERTDLAVLRIDGARLTPIEFGQSDTLNIGAPAIAVGNPLGQRGGASVTAGIISAFNREVVFGSNDRLVGMLQTDAPITRGSSGGALVDAAGRLIGITTAIGVSDAGAEGIGYATPVEVVRRITDEIIQTGTVKHPFLGITGFDHLTEEADGALVPDGAQIEDLYGEGGAAETAGIQPGDVIVAVDDTTITTMDQLISAIRLHRVGDTIDITVRRDGTTLTLPVTLGERPPDA